MVTEQPEGQEPVVEQVADGEQVEAPVAETPLVEAPVEVQAPAPAPVEVTLDQIQATQAYRNIQAENDRLRARQKIHEQAVLEAQRQEDAALLQEYSDDPKVQAIVRDRASYRGQSVIAQEETKKIQCAQSIGREYEIPFDTLMAVDVSNPAEMEAYAKGYRAVAASAQTPAPPQTPTIPTPTRQPALEHIPDAAIATQQPLLGWPKIQQAYADGNISTTEYKKQAAIHGKEV